MTAHAVPSQKRPRKSGGGILMLPFVLLFALAAAALGFVAYMLWPTWPSTPIALDAPALPITVAGVLFEIPPASIRTAMQRHPGPQDRLDLGFMWPSLEPPHAEDGKAEKPPVISGDGAKTAADVPPAGASTGQIFVTIAALGLELPPAERLRTIYPRYVDAQAATGPDGLAVLRFRPGTPYDGEDLIYVTSSPEQFFVRCTRQIDIVPGTCIQERAIEATAITLRFPRDWLNDWRAVASGTDRLVAQLHH